MFTEEQIKEKLSKVTTGADFPVLAADLKDVGLTYDETRMEDGRSMYRGRNASGKKASFTADQVKAAHSKVKSGADFPTYIQEIKALGVTHYETYVADGHTDYHGGDDYTVPLPAKYDRLIVAGTPDRERFRTALKAHQDGKTDFLTFIRTCATVGIEKWQICMENMTCTYYDQAAEEVLVEEIPQ